MLDLYLVKALGSAMGGGGGKKEAFSEEERPRRYIGADRDRNRDGEYEHRRRYSDNRDDRDNRFGRDADTVVTSISIFAVVMYIVWMVLFGIPAVYFSWTSNGLIGWNVGMKIFFAFFAFVSGLSYLFIHLINKLDLFLFIKQARMGQSAIARPLGNTAMAARGSYGNGSNGAR